MYSRSLPQHDSGPVATPFLQWHWLGKRRVWIALLLACITAAFSFQSGISLRTDEQLRIWREGILDRPASGEIHILEIDAKSISAIKAWPWPRRIHGEVVDRLAEAGVDTVAFDVDFSSPSNAEDDQLFAGALNRFDGTMILPTFIQKSATNSEDILENMPINALRTNAFLASVNVRPDKDGTIRNFSYGTVTDGTARPTMAAILANAKGDITKDFRIDTSINPATLPRHSVIDLLKGKVPLGSLKGKTIFIGATAIELGDRYAMPRHGVQPGVVIQALAAETLMLRQNFMTLDQWFSIGFAFCAAVLALSCRYLGRATLTASAGIMILLLIPFTLEYLTIATIDIAIGIYILFATMSLLGLADILGRFNYLRLVDTATGLPNERAMARVLNTINSRHVVVMKIENFSDVAAMLGMNERALLLRNVAQRLHLGSGDAEIFRLGKGRLGWLSAIENPIELTEMIDGLQAVLASKISVGADQIVISTSFGIAPISANDAAGDINKASLAAHQAELAGIRWTIFNEAMSDRNGYIQHVLADLDDAMDRGDIYMQFQPKWSLAQGAVTSVEALVRWNHSILGPISPAEFIPVLEQNSQMGRLTLHIAKVCSELAQAWQKKGRSASIAMNISAPLLVDERFTAMLQESLKALGPARKLIILEITESAAVTNDCPIIASLAEFRRLGIKISIDDYGTGQSTLSYLQKFPADEIKIDQSFVRNLLHNRSDQILVRSTIELGHELGLTVIAEGVEDAETMALLASYNCDMIQGWHIGRPMAAADVEQMIDRAPDTIAVSSLRASA